MNSVLLLNIPPDKNGLLNEHDVTALQDWKKMRDETFKTNLANNALVQCANGLRLNALLDDDDQTYFTTSGKDTSTTITFNLKGAKTFDVLLLQENISVGQRVEKFTLEYWDGKAWVKATEGTTIGYKRLLRFPAITTNKVRLSLSARLNPAIAAFWLYGQL